MEMKRYSKVILIASFVIGVGMIVVSFFLPPQGVIDPSVLKGAGMIFAFAAVVEGLLTNKVVRFRHGNTEAFIGDKENLDMYGSDYGMYGAGEMESDDDRADTRPL